MKTFITTLFATLTLFCSLEATAQTLVFHLSDGTTTDVELSSAFRMFTANGTIAIKDPNGNTKEFSVNEILSITYHETKGDVNRDNAVDVADISAIISIMAGETIYAISVTTGNVSNITDNSAKISGTVSGVSSSVRVGVLYSLESVLGLNSPNVTTTASGDFTIALTDLNPNTTYYYCVFTEVDGIYYYGETKTFKTEQDEAQLLSGMLAADPEIRLFSEALKLTGLVDTLRNYVYNDYDYTDAK